MSTPLEYVKRTPYIARYYYPPEYFSGCDVHLYANGVLIDEAVQISFVLSEGVKPIYGYASAAFDAVARMTRIVQGWFDINFRRPGYLRELLASVPSPAASVSRVSRGDDWVGRQADIYKDSEDFEAMLNSFREQYWGPAEEARSSALSPGGFDIVIAYGPQSRAYRERANTTVPSAIESINAVFLVGMAKTIDQSGSPVVERYNFIARDINQKPHVSRR